MKRMLIRYKTKPEATAQNRLLIENVFAELNAKSPEGLRYMSMMLADGSFVHVVEHADGHENPLPQLEAFSAFQGGIRERCEELPVVNEATVVGNYRMLDE
jgi:hypothetical protein